MAAVKRFVCATEEQAKAFLVGLMAIRDPEDDSSLDIELKRIETVEKPEGTLTTIELVDKYDDDPVVVDVNQAMVTWVPVRKANGSRTTARKAPAQAPRPTKKHNDSASSSRFMKIA